jgi:hypothetical protein
MMMANITIDTDAFDFVFKPNCRTDMRRARSGSARDPGKRKRP